MADTAVAEPVETVAAAVRRARSAAAEWSALPAAERRRRLLDWKRSIARRLEEPARLITEETGKPLHDARAEVVLTLTHLDWAARNAARVLGPRRVRPGLLAAHLRASVEYRPVGVVGVIGPWNYPMYTPMGSIGYALAAGNAVVFKPSECSPGIGRWLAETLGGDLLQVVTGGGETGDALARSGVDKVAFTGSPGTGRKVAAACAESLTPCLVEAGGKDALLVAADADPVAAAEAVVWGGMSNAGQTCAGVERVYAADGVFEELCGEVVRMARELTPGRDYGPLTLPAQAEVVSRHVADALAAGGRALLGGPESVAGRLVSPVVLADVPEDCSAMREETFGPVVVINRVRDLGEGVRRANAGPYALGGAVFTRDVAAGRAAARELRCGAVSVNGVLGFAAVPRLPFGGSGESGYGRIHGDEGLRAFAAARAVTVPRVRPLVDLTSFRTPAAKAERALELARRLHAWR